MNEEFIQFVWKNQLFQTPNLTTISGEKVTILHPGEYNSDAGPDFFNARIKIDETLWAGNVEIHLKSSDWLKHGHQNDPSYDNVVLHVVTENDIELKKNNGNPVPVLVLPDVTRLFSNYQKLLSLNLAIPCQQKIKHVAGFDIRWWLTVLATSRLEYKTRKIDELLSKNINHWEETFYQILARQFGFNTNSLPFENLARSLPLKILGHYKENLTQIEALLFGQAGFLDDKDKNLETDDYYKQLRSEYRFLKQKHHLNALEPYIWKFMRLRPANFPTIRIAQFAMLVHRSSSLFSKITDVAVYEQARSYFRYGVSSYWLNHYRFGNESAKKEKNLGEMAIDVILINSVIPIVFNYGKATANAGLQDKAINWLESTHAEDNNIIRMWKKSGLKPANALESQALIHLYNEYCKNSSCLDCRIGIKLIQNDIQ